MLDVRRVLVTGGAGFIGSHLCERLMEAGHDVLCADNFFTGDRVNVARLLESPRFELLRHDVTEPLRAEIDHIFNLASPASPVHYQRRPAETTRTNVHGAINMLDLARRTGARIFQASTSEVYGDPTEHPQGEGYWGNVNPIGPRACYDEGKRCAETLFFDYHREFGTDIRVARIFNCYGPRMRPDDGRVVSNFIVQALTGRRITIHGDGTQTRSFCYVDDMVTGIVRMMEAGPEAIGPINLGNPEELSILALAEAIRAAIGTGVDLDFRPRPVDDPARRCPDIGRARAVLDWTPTVSLSDGLARTIAYFDDRLSGAV